MKIRKRGAVAVHMYSSLLHGLPSHRTGNAGEIGTAVKWQIRAEEDRMNYPFYYYWIPGPQR